MQPLPTPEPLGNAPDRAARRRTVALRASVAAVIGAAAVGAFATADSGSQTIDTAEFAASAAALVTESANAAGVATGAAVLPDLALGDGELGQNAAEGDGPVEPERADGGCTIGALSLRYGATGDGVACLQDALIADGIYDGPADGVFDEKTVSAVQAFQTDNDLYVDGVVGRESAIELDIWPDEESFVTRTPAPAPGATDLWGVELSPVASAGDDAPPLPENSGSGRRVVYDRAGQRVWAVDGEGQILRSWLVSGSKYSNEMPGTHQVYSRSDMSTAWNGKAWLPQMIRYQRTEIGHIGFHAIPLHVNDNSPYQTTDELGTRLSGGCQRQHNLDAAFLWAFAEVGTTVVVT
ncbi:MAG: L,D-transpeptidase family protein [Actinomycetota bacterium]